MLRWIWVDDKAFSIPEETFRNIMSLDKKELAFYLVDPDVVIRKLAYFRISKIASC